MQTLRLFVKRKSFFFRSFVRVLYVLHTRSHHLLSKSTYSGSLLCDGAEKGKNSVRQKRNIEEEKTKFIEIILRDTNTYTRKTHKNCIFNFYVISGIFFSYWWIFQ